MDLNFLQPLSWSHKSRLSLLSAVLRGGWDVAGRQNLNCGLKCPGWVAASLPLREAGLESNPPPQGCGLIPLYYWECFYHSLSLCKETVARVPSVSSKGQQDDLFTDLSGCISGLQSLMLFCSCKCRLEWQWNSFESLFFLRAPHMNNSSDICLWVIYMRNIKTLGSPLLCNSANFHKLQS